MKILDKNRMGDLYDFADPTPEDLLNIVEDLFGKHDISKLREILTSDYGNSDSQEIKGFLTKVIIELEKKRRILSDFSNFLAGLYPKYLSTIHSDKVYINSGCVFYSHGDFLIDLYIHPKIKDYKVESILDEIVIPDKNKVKEYKNNLDKIYQDYIYYENQRIESMIDPYNELSGGQATNYNNDFEKPDSSDYCERCQQTPCMCSDPY